MAVIARRRVQREATPKTSPAAEPRRGVCRICLCTHWQACSGGCYWVDKKETLCSSCEWFAEFTREQVIAFARALGVVFRRPGRYTHDDIESAVAIATERFEQLGELGYVVKAVAKGEKAKPPQPGGRRS